MTPAPILVTGGGRRLGLYLVERLLAAGQRVILSHRREHPALDRLRAAGAVCLRADFTGSESILDFVAEVRACTPSLRAIIHNASDWAADAPSGSEAARVFEQLFRVHMQAPYLINLGCRDLLEAHAEAHARAEGVPPPPGADGEGIDDTGVLPAAATDIIHLTDHVVARGSAKHAAYAASKAGLDNLTRSFAAMYAPRIKVNAIAPALLAFHPDDDPAYRRKARAKSALGRVPGFDVAWQTVRYLLDNPYLTGATLPLDGGRSVRGG
jgi:dihydromonapterin reductase / dihydrofolate reductase